MQAQILWHSSHWRGPMFFPLECRQVLWLSWPTEYRGTLWVPVVGYRGLAASACSLGTLALGAFSCHARSQLPWGHHAVRTLKPAYATRLPGEKKKGSSLLYQFHSPAISVIPALVPDKQEKRLDDSSPSYHLVDPEWETLSKNCSFRIPGSRIMSKIKRLLSATKF